MAVAYHISGSKAGGSILVLCLSSDTKPAGNADWLLFETDTGNRFLWNGSAWAAPVPASMTAHLAAGDPHPQYLTEAEADALYEAIGGGGGAAWGGITGTLSAQTDLQTALDGKQPLATVLTNTTAAFTTAQETKLGAISGTNTGDQTTITGNAGTATALQTSRNFSISGSGITAATVGFTGAANVVLAGSVDAGHITLARMADMATASLIYRKTAGTGAPEVQTLATLKTDLGLTGTNTGDQTSIVGITGTLAQFNTAVTDADILSVATAASTYQPLDAQLTDLSSLAYASNSLKVLRVNAGETAFELVTLAGGGNVTGPGSSTDNAITRYDGTSGTSIQNSAATVSDDGIIRSATDSGANTVTVPLANWIMLTADYALSNVATEQKAFNTTTNGALTLPTGVYEFECFLYILAMSATSGNAAFDPIGAGTAVADRFGYDIVGIDNASPLNAGTLTGSASVTQQSVASAVTAGTAVGMRMAARGMFRVSTGGTIIPSITLVTANAATMKAGSHFKIKKIGESSETSVGAWT